MAQVTTRRFHLMAVITLTLLTLLTYARGLTSLPVGEDFFVMEKGLLTPSQMLAASLNAVRVRPILDGYEYALVQAFGGSPLALHLMSLGLHLGVTLLLYALVRRLSGSSLVGLGAALLFSIYPRHHQTVLWFSADPFLLMALFSLGCVYLFSRYVETHRPRWLVGAAVTYALGLLVHEASLFVLPLLVALAALLYERDKRAWLRPRAWLKYLPFVLIAAAFVLVNVSGSRLFKLSGDAAGVAQSDQTYRLLNLGGDTVRDTLAYLTYWAFPQIPLRSLDPNVMTALLALTVVLVTGALFIWGSPLVRLGIVWSGVTLLPYILLVPFGNADRYFYLAAAGWAMSLSAFAWQTAQRFPQVRVLPAAAAALVGAYVLTSVLLMQQRVDEWHVAGQSAAAIVDSAAAYLPNPHAEATLLFVNLPGVYGQAYVFHTGAAPALRQRYARPDLHIYQTNDAETCDCLRRLDSSSDAPVPLVVFLYDNGELTASTYPSTVIAQLHPERWYPPVAADTAYTQTQS